MLWQLAQWPLGTTAPETALHTGVWVHISVGIFNQSCIQVFEYVQAFGSPTGATHRCLESQPGLHTGVGVCPGVWIPNRGYIQAFDSPTGATHRWQVRMSSFQKQAPEHPCKCSSVKQGLSSQQCLHNSSSGGMTGLVKHGVHPSLRG